jgi:hypothetical protein
LFEQQPFGVAVDGERRNSAVIASPHHPRENHIEVGQSGIGGPGLAAVDDVMIAIQMR